MQDPACELPRNPIPRTTVNKGKMKGRSLEMPRPFFLPLVLQGSQRSLFIAYCLSHALYVLA